MRILIVASEIAIPGAHGGATHVVELVQQLRRRAEVLALVRRGSEGDDLCAVAPLPRRASLTRLTNLYALARGLTAVRTFAPDVIYERATSRGLGALFSRALGRPLVVGMIDGRYSEWSLKRARRIVATDLEMIPARHRDKGEKVSWGVNDELFRPRPASAGLRSQLSIPDDCPIAVYTGSFLPWHGLADLLEAVRLLKPPGGDIRRELHLLLVGGGDEYGRIREIARSMDIAHRVHLPGAVAYREVPDYLALADVAVAPMRPELHGDSRGQQLPLDPLKLFEYLAMELPAVAARSDNLTKLFSGGEVSFYDAGSPESLAMQLTRLIECDATRRDMAIRGRKVVVERHTWSRHANQLLDLFGSLLVTQPEP